MILAQIRRKMRSAFKLPRFTLFWLPLALIFSGLARLTITFVPFRHFAPVLGKSHGLAAIVPLATTHQMCRAQQIRKLIIAMGRNALWPSNCFDQAIVARIFLGIYRLPYAVYFGLERDRSTQAKELSAHAWVAVGPCPVSGGFGFEKYTVVQGYIPHGWQAIS